MKNFFFNVFFFVLITLSGFSGVTYAQQILTFTNSSKSNVFLGIRFLDAKSTAWITRGWIPIAAAQEKVIPIDTTGEIMYYFVLDKKGTEWGGTKSDSDDRLLWIVNKNFRVVGDAKPVGKKQHKVWFDALMPEDDGSFAIEIID